VAGTGADLNYELGVSSPGRFTRARCLKWDVEEDTYLIKRQAQGKRGTSAALGMLTRNASPNGATQFLEVMIVTALQAWTLVS
jgi:hypothetical protein